MSFEEMMKQLQAEYIKSLPSKVKEIEGHKQGRAVDILREDFHKLKGTGKTYGLPEISQLAETVEKICIHRPSKAIEAVEAALPLLTHIHQERLQSKCVDLLRADSFQKIIKLAA